MGLGLMALLKLAFVANAEERTIAEKSLAAAEAKLGKKIVVPIRDTAEFTAAEDYHQNFYKTNPWHYYRYRVGCGRDGRLEEVWSTPGKS